MNPTSSPKKTVFGKAGALASAALLVCTLCACAGNQQSADDLDNVRSGADFHSANIMLESMDFDIPTSDADPAYDAENAAEISLDDSGTTSNGLGIETEGSVTTITTPGTYVISGTLSEGQLCVDVADSSTVRLVLANCNINNPSGPAIFIKSAESVCITLPDGTQNILSDGNDYTLEESRSHTGNDAAGAALCSTASLCINGSGRLGAIGNASNGIFTEQTLIVTDGDIAVNANGDALHGCKGVKVSGGTLNLNSGRYGIMSCESEDRAAGFISVTRGNINISSTDDGIHASTYVRLMDGFFNIASGRCSIYSEVEGRIAGGQYDLSAVDSAICAPEVLHMEGGEVRIGQSNYAMLSEKLLIDGGISNAETESVGLAALPADFIESNFGPNADSEAGAAEFPTDIQDPDCLIQATMGSVDAFCGNDVLYSCGNIVINGGVFQCGTTDADCLGIYYAIDGRINGGRAIITSTGNGINDFNGGSVSSMVSPISGDAGATVRLLGPGDSSILAYVSPLAFNSILIADVAIQPSAELTLSVDGQSTTLAANV